MNGGSIDEIGLDLGFGFAEPIAEVFWLEQHRSVLASLIIQRRGFGL